MHVYTCNMNMHASTHTNKHVHKWCTHACKVPHMHAVTEHVIAHFLNFFFYINLTRKCFYYKFRACVHVHDYHFGIIRCVLCDPQ